MQVLVDEDLLTLTFPKVDPKPRQYIPMSASSASSGAIPGITRLALFHQQGMVFLLTSKESNRTETVPALQGFAFMLAFRVRKLQFKNGRSFVRLSDRQYQRDIG